MSTDWNQSRSNRARASEPILEETQELYEECSPTLSLTVLFTNVPGTLAALREAAHWAHQLGARIRILVTHVVPYPLPIHKPQVDPAFRLRHFRTLCEQVPIETRLEIRLCRDIRQCIHDALAPQSLILVSSPPGWWPFTYEQRLLRSLQKAGHQVVLVTEKKP